MSKPIPTLLNHLYYQINDSYIVTKNSKFGAQNKYMLYLFVSPDGWIHNKELIIHKQTKSNIKKLFI